MIEQWPVRPLPVIALGVLFVGAAGSVAAQQRGAERKDGWQVAVAQDVGEVQLVKCTEQQAVVRIGPRLELIRLGDRLGRTQAVVKELAAGRMELEETFIGKDGAPNHALIVLSEGERGGTRYLQRSEEPRLVGITPARPKPTPSQKP